MAVLPIILHTRSGRFRDKAGFVSTSRAARSASAPSIGSGRSTGGRSGSGGLRVALRVRREDVGDLAHAGCGPGSSARVATGADAGATALRLDSMRYRSARFPSQAMSHLPKTLWGAGPAMRPQREGNVAPNLHPTLAGSNEKGTSRSSAST